MKNYYWVLCYIWILFVSVSCDGIDVDLSKYHPGTNGHTTFSKFYNVSKDTVKLDIFNINDDVGFLLVQVHSFIENVTLSESTKLLPHSYVTGTNIGLIWANNNSDATLYLMRNIKVGPTIKILLVINIYDEEDPVPGGCNLTFETVIAPYQKITYTNDVIKVHSQPPWTYGISCDANKIEVEMYHLYLDEYNNKQETYFNGLNKMITVENIKANGKRIYSLEGKYKYGRLFSSYRGTGEIFGIVATYKNRSSAYVPAVSYGCNILFWDTDCIGPVSVHWKVLCATLFLLGLFVCFFGHKFFKLTLFLMGFTFEVLITYLVVSQQENSSTKETEIASVAFGILYGIVWVLLWWKFGIPLLSAILAFSLAGTLVASLVFYAGLANFYIFTNDTNFWATFLCIVIICLLILTPAIMHGHIFSCSFLGGYATVVATNYYTGGNLQYIFLNFYRRLAVKNFRFAIIDPPFQNIDLIQSLLWITLFLFGYYIQLRSQRNKPPFPPNRHRPAPDMVTETTPLLRANAPPEYV